MPSLSAPPQLIAAAAAPTAATANLAASAPPAVSNHADEPTLPKGHCRYILTTPGLKGHRCACVSFMHNKALPGATCECGHLPCFHLTSAEYPSPAGSRHEVDMLKQRVQMLEEHTDWGADGGLGGVLSRVSQAEEAVEKHREEMQADIKASYKSISGAWELIEQLQKRLAAFEESFRVHNEHMSKAGKELQELRNRHLELLDSDEILEERIERLENIVAQPLPILDAPALAREAASVSLNTPLNTPGAPEPRPVAMHDEIQLPVAASASLTMPSRPLSTDSWTVHISLLPSPRQLTPFDKDSVAYKRCLSRGLHKMVAVQGTDATSFQNAVSEAFAPFLQGRPWGPCRVRPTRDVLRGFPVFRPSHASPYFCDAEYLSTHCALCDPNGRMEAIYIALIEHELSWEQLRKYPVYLDGLESSWAYDEILDGSDASKHDQDEFRADIAPKRSPRALKRNAAEMVRVPELVSAGSALHEEGSRAKVARTCMPGLVEVRRGLETAS